MREKSVSTRFLPDMTYRDAEGRNEAIFLRVTIA